MMDEVVTHHQVDIINGTMMSNYYLERVGFEAKVNLRQNLKNGKNLIGRNNTRGVDIAINSRHCSRHHCVIHVSDDSVKVEDLKSANGTAVNGVNMEHGTKVSLIEKDLIGIVGGTNPLHTMVGNYNFIVYRLCKYDSENIQTFEIEDDDPIELSDEEDNVINLDSDGEAVDVNEQDDLDIQLSRSFNIEIKKELEELEEFDELSQIKMELPDFDCNENDDHFIDNNEMFREINERNISTVANANEDGAIDDKDSDNNSSDSNKTICFPSTSKQNNNLVNDAPANNENQNENTIPFSDQTNPSKELEPRLKEILNKINVKNERKRTKISELIYAKPLKKRRRFKAEQKNVIKKRTESKTDIKADKKEKLKAIASTSSKFVSDEKQTGHTTPKVKFTPNNRGSFLTDATQSPALPKDIKRKQKVPCKSITQRATLNTENVRLNTQNIVSVPTPPELEHQLWQDMNANQDQITLLNFQPSSKSTECQDQMPLLDMQPLPKSAEYHETIDMEIDTDDDSESFDTDSLLCQAEAVDAIRDVNADGGIEMDVEENKEEGQEEEAEDEEAQDDDDEEDDDEDIDLLKILMQLPPETDTVKVIETQPRPANLKSILKSAQWNRMKDENPKRKVTFKENVFQYDPRHKIISDITAYDQSQHDTVVAFCKSVDINIKSFENSYEDYEEYRSTLVALMMVELWKEIELEYINSETHCTFTTVTVNDINREKRGEGFRMIFHCQADSLYKTQSICDGHLVFVKCMHNGKEIEFVALITSMAYANKVANQRLAYFTMETSGLTEILPVKLLQIRPITVITNTLNALNAIYALKHSPLKNLVVNPLSEASTSQLMAEDINYKVYDPLDDTQRRILNAIYRRCINLQVPSISLLDGAAGTGKSCMIANLALQLVYGDSLPKPLKILICSKSHGCINDLTTKLINIRDNTSVATKIQVVRFGFLEHMDSFTQRVSVQNLKEVYQQFTSYEDMVNQKHTLELKISALNFYNDRDHSTEVKSLQKHMFKVNALLSRFEGVEKKKLRDKTTFLLNSCDIICTTMGCIPKLQNYVSKVDVCILDEATQCNEPLTLLPLQFRMPSLVLVGDSQFIPLTVYSAAVKQRNYGNSLFARWKKLYWGKFPNPIFEMNFQYRIHQEILIWPNCQFYQNHLVPHDIVKDDSFPIAPYKLLSYSSNKNIKESENIMLLIKVVLNHVNHNEHSIGIICTNFKQNSIMRNKLRDHPYITTDTAESYIGEKDVAIIWISEEHGIGNIAHQQILNAAVTRAKKSLLICGANLASFKNRPVWRSLLENANGRKCMQHFNVLTVAKVCNSLRKNIPQVLPSVCNKCNA